MDQGNNTKSPDLDPNMHVQLILNSDAKMAPWRKGNLLDKWSWNSWKTRCTKLNIGPNLGCIKSQLKLNAKLKTINFCKKIYEKRFVNTD